MNGYGFPWGPLVLLSLRVAVMLAIPGLGLAQTVPESLRLAPGLPLQLESSFLSLDGQRWQGTARGDVEILHAGVTLRADEVFLDVLNNLSQAKGRVSLLHGQDLLLCDGIEFDWVNLTGQVENGDLTIQDTGYRIQASLLEKTGPDTYRLEDAAFTTCRCPDPSSRLPWQIKTRESEVTLGGYARIRKATFHLFEIPVFYLPSGFLPVKMHRESGFLVPRVSQSGNNGWGLAVPFFWAINASLDTTLTLEGLTKRGVKPSLQFRYRPDQRTEGEWEGSLFQDLEDDRLRYAGTARHAQELPFGFYDKFDLRAVSEDDYIQDFPDEVGSTADRLLESRGVVGFRTGDLHTAVEGVYADLLEGPGGMRLAQAAPQWHLNYIRHPAGLPGLAFSWNSVSRTYFSEDGEGRARSEYFPAGFLSLPLLPGLALQGYAGVREVLSSGELEAYRAARPCGGGSDPGDAVHRTLVETGAELAARLGRGYAWGQTALYHLCKPSVQFQWIRRVEGSPFPVVMDGLDTLERRRWLTWSVNNSLWGRRTGSAETGSQGLLAELRLTQSADLDTDSETAAEKRRLSDLRIASRLYPLPFLSLALDLQIDPVEASVRTLETGVGLWTRQRDYGIYAGYLKHRPYGVAPLTRVELVDVYDLDYAFAGIPHTLRTRLEARPFPRISAMLETLYLVEESGKIENHFSVKILSGCECWSVVLRFRNTVRPDDYGFSVRFQLEGLGSSRGEESRSLIR